MSRATATRGRCTGPIWVYATVSAAGGCGQEQRDGEQQPVVVGAPGLLAHPAFGFVAADRAGLLGGGGVPDDQGQHGGAGEHGGVGLDVDVVEAGVALLEPRVRVNRRSFDARLPAARRRIS